MRPPSAGRLVDLARTSRTRLYLLDGLGPW
jgi:hypothetical protein